MEFPKNKALKNIKKMSQTFLISYEIFQLLSAAFSDVRIRGLQSSGYCSNSQVFINGELELSVHYGRLADGNKDCDVCDGHLAGLPGVVSLDSQSVYLLDRFAEKHIRDHKVAWKGH